MMCELRKLKTTPVKLIPFLLQILFCWILSLDGSTAEPPPQSGVLNYRRDEPRFIPKFKYGYMVRALEGGQHGHQVYHNGPYTQGKYFVKLNGGSGQNVEYYADHLGYHPKVAYTNTMDTGSSGARIAFGKAVQSFNVPNVNHFGARELNDTKNHNDTSTYGKPINNPTANQTTIVTSIPADTLSRINENFTTAGTEKLNLETASVTSLYSAEDGNRDSVASNLNSIGTVEPILLPQHADDPYLQPEINEISSGFVNKIVSMLPGIFAAKTKLKPIIVTDNTGASKREASENGTSTDQVVESAQPEEYHQIPDEQTLLDDKRSENQTRDAAGNVVPKYTEADIKKPQVDVEIEPQMLEEQAVITTTVDIMKSLPLAVNFVPETDNHINDFGQAFNVPLNLVPTPHQEMLPPVVSGPTVMELQFPVQEQPLPAEPDTQFHYIPIPVFQHQPNVIPLNYVNENRTLLDAVVESTNNQAENLPFPMLDQLPPIDGVPNYSLVKSVEELPNLYKPMEYHRKPMKYQPQHIQFDFRKPLQMPYALNVPAAHLIPYVKNFPSQNFASQNFIQQPYPKQVQPNVPPKAQSVSYNLKYFPKETRKPQQSKTPFRPSHPLWDSVYPPSHMYQVPYYVVDKMPGERNARDSFTRRNHHLRRLEVEYGGFKPPMVPSTLIEPEETSEKAADVPKEKSDA